MFRIVVALFFVVVGAFADDLVQDSAQNVAQDSSVDSNADSPQKSVDSEQNNTSEFIEALKGGEKSGDINLLFDFNHDSDTSPKNNAYLATSFGLYYKSAFY